VFFSRIHFPLWSILGPRLQNRGGGGHAGQCSSYTTVWSTLGPDGVLSIESSFETTVEVEEGMQVSEALSLKLLRSLVFVVLFDSVSAVSPTL